VTSDSIIVYYDLVDTHTYTHNDRNAKKLILYEATTDADNFCPSSTNNKFSGDGIVRRATVDSSKLRGK
jgi:hypothetical protein